MWEYTISPVEVKSQNRERRINLAGISTIVAENNKVVPARTAFDESTILHDSSSGGEFPSTAGNERKYISSIGPIKSSLEEISTDSSVPYVGLFHVRDQGHEFIKTFVVRSPATSDFSRQESLCRIAR